MALAVLPPLISRTLADFRRRLAERFGERLADLRLFGSYARGEAGPDSDVDVAVVVRDLIEGERREVFELAEEVYFDSLVRVCTRAALPMNG